MGRRNTQPLVETDEGQSPKSDEAKSRAEAGASGIRAKHVPAGMAKLLSISRKQKSFQVVGLLDQETASVLPIKATQATIPDSHVSDNAGDKRERRVELSDVKERLVGEVDEPNHQQCITERLV